MAYFRTCPKCGDNLDPGETCECMKKKAPYRYIVPRVIIKGYRFETQIDGTIKIYAGDRECSRKFLENCNT